MFNVLPIEVIPYYPDVDRADIDITSYIVTKVRIKRNDKWYVILVQQSYETPSAPIDLLAITKLYYSMSKLNRLHEEVYNIINRYIIQENDIDKLDILQIDEVERLNIIDGIVRDKPVYDDRCTLEYYRGLHQNRPDIW